MGYSTFCDILRIFGKYQYSIIWLSGSKTSKHLVCWGAGAAPEHKRNDKRRVEPVFWEFIHVTGSTKSTVIDFHTILVCEVLVNTENVFHFTQSVTQSRALLLKRRFRTSLTVSFVLWSSPCTSTHQVLASFRVRQPNNRISRFAKNKQNVTKCWIHVRS